MRLSQIIIERGDSDLWYHGSPDARGLVDQFELRSDTIIYIADPDKWEKLQDQMHKTHGVDEKAYHKLIDQAGPLQQFKSITKPVFLTNNRSVANSYARDKPAFDYQDSEPRVVTVRTTPGKILTVNGLGAQFRGIALTSVYRGLNAAGFSKEDIDQIIRHYPRSVFQNNTLMSTDGLSAIAQQLGFDTVDVINVQDNYTGAGPKATVRAIFDPDRIHIVQPGVNEEDFRGASYRNVDTGEIMAPDGNHGAVVWGHAGGDDQREQALMGEIDDGDWEAGFVTNDGRFLDRRQAAEYIGKEISPGARHNYLDTDDPEFQMSERAEPRTIEGAAYLHVPTGDIYGPYDVHFATFYDPKMLAFLGTENDSEWVSDETSERLVDLIQNGKMIDGFVTSDNKFLTRKEAAKAVNLDAEPDISVGNPLKRDWLDSTDLEMGFDTIHEDYQWGNPDTRRNAEAGRMVGRALFNIGKNAYLVEIYDLSSQARVYGFGDELFQIGFRPANQDGYEGNMRTGDESNPRAVINGVKQIMIDWVRDHKPEAIIVGSPDSQKARIFTMLAQRSQGIMDQLGYSSQPFMSMGVVFIRNEEVTEMEHDEGERDDGYWDEDKTHNPEHQVAMDQTGYWGSAGAGCIIMANDTKRVLLPLRSEWVEQPHTWGTWGGALDPGEDPKDAAMREVSEEAGYPGKVLAIEPLFRYQDESFRYDTFLVVVAEEFEAKLNWETEKADWFTIGQWPSPLHFGLEAVLKDSNARNKIGMAGS